MRIDQKLVDAAIAQALGRFPEGYAGAAALYTEDGQILTSVCFDGPNESTNLCHETGAICEANRLGLRITASACVSRANPGEPFVILTPCGLCQERLALWGQDVEVAIPDADDSSHWLTKTLRQVQPYYWRNAVDDNDT
jgi:cytidine deaminase